MRKKPLRNPPPFGGSQSAPRDASARPARDPLSRVKLREADPVEKRHATAFLLGRDEGPTAFTTLAKGKCLSPVVTTRHYRASPRTGGRYRVETLVVRCRTCEVCVRERQLGWRDRCREECAAAKRTWMVTFTFGPVQMAAAIMAGKADLLSRPRATLRECVESAAYRLFVAPFLNLLRKQAHKGFACSFVTFTEYGEHNGRLHFHMLLHETGTRPVSERMLRRAYRGGFLRALLVHPDNEDGATSYVTKYVTKDNAGTVRPSKYYGDPERRKREAAAKAAASPAPSLSPIGQAPPEDRGDGRGAESSEPGRVAEGPAPATGPGGEANGPPPQGSGPKGRLDTSCEGRDTRQGDMPGSDGDAVRPANGPERP